MLRTTSITPAKSSAPATTASTTPVRTRGCSRTEVSGASCGMDHSPAPAEAAIAEPDPQSADRHERQERGEDGGPAEGRPQQPLVVQIDADQHRGADKAQ